MIETERIAELYGIVHVSHYWTYKVAETFQYVFDNNFEVSSQKISSF